MPEPTRIIEVLPYNADWKTEFLKLKEMLYTYIGDFIIDIEHVGSTAVEGLAAKPIIDIDVVMEGYEIFPRIIKALEEQGFIYEGDLGIEGREAFRRSYDDGFMKYHLYVCPKDGRGYLEHIALRDYLRVHPKAVKEYSELKYKLAEAYKYDINSYCEEKTDFIRNILNNTLYKDR